MGKAESPCWWFSRHWLGVLVKFLSRKWFPSLALGESGQISGHIKTRNGKVRTNWPTKGCVQIGGLRYWVSAYREACIRPEYWVSGGVCLVVWQHTRRQGIPAVLSIALVKCVVCVFFYLAYSVQVDRIVLSHTNNAPSPHVDASYERESELSQCIVSNELVSCSVVRYMLLVCVHVCVCVLFSCVFCCTDS